MRREGYPTDQLPVAEITWQYLACPRGSAEVDVYKGTEFCETAAWLTLLKSRALSPTAAGEEAPEQELTCALLDHEALRGC